MDGFGVVRALAYHQHGIPKLALRDFGVDSGVVLWVDLAEDGVDFRFGDCTCLGGWALALLVSDFVRWGLPNLRHLSVSTLSRLLSIPRPPFEYSFSK